MNVPTSNHLEVFRLCVDAAKTDAEKLKYLAHEPHIIQATADYATHGTTQTWYALPRSARGNDNQVVAGQLTKGNLTALYTSYMVGTTGPSRNIYDQILVSAGGKCPFCGGIGQARNIDHYLPKSYFPLFSVHPHNLVPSCRDCNTEKNATFPLVAGAQGLHPYLDAHHFFNERWVYASVNNTDPVTVQFSAIPPANWSQTDQSRAIAHFNNNDLPLRYSVQSSSTLTIVIGSRRTSLSNLTPQQFSNHLQEIAMNQQDELVINGWERTLYLGLAESAWFCSQAF